LAQIGWGSVSSKNRFEAHPVEASDWLELGEDGPPLKQCRVPHTIVLVDNQDAVRSPTPAVAKHTDRAPAKLP
jgi:hypothetical protein